MITLYFLYFYAILSLERDSDRVRKIHNPNQQPRKSQEVCEVPSGSQKGKKKKSHTTPHHLSATYQLYTKGGDMGGAEYLWLESLFTLFRRSCTQRHSRHSTTEVILILLFFDVSP